MHKHITALFRTIVLVPALISSLTGSGQSGCKLTISTATWEINGHTNAADVKPGDTICLLPGPRNFLWLSYLHGTAQAPIVIQNSGGRVDISGHYFGVKIDSCSHIKFSGRGSDSFRYGTFIHDVEGVGLSIQGLSTDVEVEGLEIARTKLPGIYAKSDPDTLFNSTRDKYVLRNTVIHDNYIHHTTMEGLYIGNSFYFGETIRWHGKDTLVFPHALKGVQIYSNHIDSTGWDGIQVSSADSGCFIHHNYVYADSQLEELGQMSGILIGGGSNCQCYNNSVMNGKGDGIDIFGQGHQFIYNNFVFQAGRNYRPSDLYSPFFKVGIYAGKTSVNQPTTLGIHYNTIVYPKSYGIRFAEYPGTGHLITNNIVVGPGMYFKEGNHAFIMRENSSTDVIWTNNISSPYCREVGFRDTLGCNYDLLATSPAVDKGTMINGLQLDWDLMCRWRPFARGLDIGAWECDDPMLIGIEETEAGASAMIRMIHPNPVRDKAIITINLLSPCMVNLQLFNLKGERVMELMRGEKMAGTHPVEINLSGLDDGYYFCVLTTPSGFAHKGLVVRKQNQ